jgi:hypothetical protein
MSQWLSPRVRGRVLTTDQFFSDVYSRQPELESVHGDAVPAGLTRLQARPGGSVLLVRIEDGVATRDLRPLPQEAVSTTRTLPGLTGLAHYDAAANVLLVVAAQPVILPTAYVLGAPAPDRRKAER